MRWFPCGHGAMIEQPAAAGLVGIARGLQPRATRSRLHDRVELSRVNRSSRVSVLAQHERAPTKGSNTTRPRVGDGPRWYHRLVRTYKPSPAVTVRSFNYLAGSVSDVGNSTRRSN